MIFELTLLTGRLHATPWGRHVNEAVPEWPPSPFRILRALVDVWYRKHDEIPEEIIERVLSAISAPPVYSLPPARSGHTRAYLAQNGIDSSDKKLVFDGFAIVDRGSRILVGWPGLKLDVEAREAAEKLVTSLNYLGRSETWVKARVVDDHTVEWNCVPLEAGTVAANKEVVRVAGVVPPSIFQGRAFQVPAQGKTKARLLPWMEALTWGSAETIDHTMNRPPALEPLFYTRDRDALDARPKPARRTSISVVDAVRFAVDSKVRVPITDALRVGDQIRRRLMGGERQVVGSSQLSSTFSGKDLQGRPVLGHPHVSILSLDEDQDGFIDAILVVSPKPFSIEEQRAIDRLAPVRRRNGHPMILTPTRYGTREELGAHTRTIRSQTPFAPTQHWRLKRDGDEGEWLVRQLALECERRGLPAPVEAQRIAPPLFTQRRARWLDFVRSRKDDSPQPAYGLMATFAEPVLAPLSLGYGSHFGLGCFVAAREAMKAPSK